MRKEIIALLKSSDPKDRAKGIKQLAVSNDPDAMKILGAVYKKETHPGVKKLATQVAQDIKSREGNPVASNTKRDPKQAKIYLERSMDALINLKNDDAWKWAQEAFLANPDYAEDDYAVGLASEITGVDKSIAVETLMRNSTSPTLEKAKRSTRKNSDVEHVSWGKALTGVGIYSVLVGITFYLPFLLLGRFITFFTDFGTTASELAEIGITPDQLSGSLGMIGIITAISAVIATAIGVLIQYGMVHVSATMILGGNGYLTNLLYNLRIPLITQFLVQVAIFGIMIFLIVSSFPSNPQVWESAQITGDYSAFEDNGETTAILNAMNGLNSLVSLGFTVWICMVIGKTYDFSGIKGCLSIIISSILMAVVMCGCYFTIITSVISTVGLE